MSVKYYGQDIYNVHRTNSTNNIIYYYSYFNYGICVKRKPKNLLKTYGVFRANEPSVTHRKLNNSAQFIIHSLTCLPNNPKANYKISVGEDRNKQKHRNKQKTKDKTRQQRQYKKFSMDNRDSHCAARKKKFMSTTIIILIRGMIHYKYD